MKSVGLVTIVLTALVALPSAASAACTLSRTMPRDGSVGVNSPRFTWTGSADCVEYRVQWSASGTFAADVTASAWSNRRFVQLSEAVWESRQTGPWSGGVYWRVLGRDAAGAMTVAPAAHLTMDPDLDDDLVSVGAGDCDDADPAVAPGLPDDTCDGVDNDCDLAADEDAPVTTVYADLDGDGFGDPSSAMSATCDVPSGVVLDGSDCDDGAPWINPGAAEVCDGVDNNCDLTADDALTCPVYCHVQWPCWSDALTDAETDAYYAWVYAPGTAGAGQGGGLVVDLGVGPDGTSPGSEDWTWTEATYNADTDGLFPGDLANDEYATSMIAPADGGSYDVAARVSGDGGLSWMFCDAGPTCGGGGSDDGYNAPVTLEVSAPVPVPVDYCHVQWPCATTTTAGATSENVYVVVFEDGVTQGDWQGGGVSVQVGVGAPGTSPDSGWSWSDASYNASVHGLSWGDFANDEYAGAFVAPGTPGTYEYAGRVTADGGLSWLYCDLGPSCGGGGSGDGYSVGGTATVVP
jgi:hypothetical protein